MSSLKHFHSALPPCLTKVGTPMSPCFIQPAGSRRASTLSSVLQPVSALWPWLFFVLYQEVQEVNNEETQGAQMGDCTPPIDPTNLSWPRKCEGLQGIPPVSRWDTPDSINEPAYKPKPRTTFKFFYLHWVFFSPEKWGDTMLSQIYCVNCRSWFCCCLLLLWERLWYLFWRHMMLFSIYPVGNSWFSFASFLVPYPQC